MKPEQALEILLKLLNRCPMNEAEVLGANVCADVLRKALGELKGEVGEKK